MRQGGPGGGVTAARSVLDGRMACAVAAVVVGLCLSAPLGAVVVPQSPDPQLGPKVKVDERLRLSPAIEPLERARAEMNPHAVAAWDAFRGRGRGPWQAHVNRGSGLVEAAEGAGEPWLPGRGNDLTLRDVAGFLNGRGRPDIGTVESRARAFLPEVEAMLGTERRLLVRSDGSGPLSDHLWNLDFDVYTVDGLRIDNARVYFRVNHGNLIQFGADGLPPADAEAPPALLTADQALAILADYVGGLTPGRDWLWDRGTELAVVVNSAPGHAPVAVGRGSELARVWQFGFVREGRHETWRARVDATTGEVLEFRDTNQYAQVTGGAWPVSWEVDGVKQPQIVYGWPFARLTPQTATTNSSGIYLWDSPNVQTASHTGNPYVTINDNCGASSLSSDASGNVQWGTISALSTPGDCQTPGGGPGNTASARQQYYHVAKIMEKGRTYLPSNTWLQGQIPVNVNINQNCNAFWGGGSLNFYRSGSGCGNTGEDAGVSLHEWGHGMDSNDGNGSSLDNGTGETYGDFSAALQTRNPCIGQGFRLTGQCGGYSNACTICDGVRDIDWGRHANNAPWTVNTFTRTNCPADASYVGPCGNKEGHCESYVSSGALYDFAAYDLQSGCGTRNAAFPDYNCGSNPIPTPNTGTGGPYDAAGAWQVADRLWYLSRAAANKAFTCTTGTTYTSNGCNAGSNWRTMRAVDDDDGNLANGTPHSCQLAAAFSRAGIACTTDTAWNVCFRGCTPPPTPTLNNPVAGNNLLNLSWSAPAGSEVFDLYRNEIGCSAGYTKVASGLTGTSYVDDDVANGTTYYYQLVARPVGGDSCASAPSSCKSGTPAATASVLYVTGSAGLTAQTNNTDADTFVDNCEGASMSFQLYNDGNVNLTNVRATITTSSSGVTIPTAMPVNLGSIAVPGGTNTGRATGSFNFTLDGMTCGGTANFTISVVADQMPTPRVDTFSRSGLEQDYTLSTATHTFETGTDGWTLNGFTRDTTAGAPASPAASLHSSSGANGACDKAISPLFKVQAAPAPSVAMTVRYDIEARSQGKWWDRANVHAVNATTGVHTLLTPTGRIYETTNTVSGVCHIGSENGWAGSNLTWGTATFSLAGLTAGQEYYLEVNYNTDGAVAPTGFWFDHVQWSNVQLIGCDAQSNSCTACTPPPVPTGVAANATAGKITVTWNASVGATSYRIYRSLTSGGPYSLQGTVTAPTTTYDDTAVTPGVTYYYVVRSATTCESASSTQVSATGAALCSTPSAPTGVGATSTVANEVNVSWTTNASSSYEVLRATTSGGPYTSVASGLTTSPYTDSGLSGGTTYYYVVRARNNPSCDSALSSEASVVVLGDCTSRPTFAGATTVTALANGQGCGLRVSWGAASSNCSSGSGVAYNVYRSTTSGFVPDGSTLLASCVGGTAYDDTTAALGTTYHYVVRAEDAGGAGTGLCGAGLEDLNTVQASAGTGTWTAGAESGDPTLTLSNWTTTTLQKRSGLASYAASGVNTCGMLTTPSLTLDATATASLGFYLRRAFAVHQGGDALEAVRVEISVNGGAWSLLTPAGGYTHQLKENVNNGACNYNKNLTQWIGGTNTSFVPFTADLTAYKGQSIQLRWVYVSGSSTSGGAWLDDISVVTVGSCTSAPQPVSFLSTTGKSGQVTAQWVNPATYTGPTRLCRSTSDYPADPGNTACPAGATRIDEPGTASAADSATFSSLVNGATQYLGAFVNNGTGVYSGRRTSGGYPIDTTSAAKWNFATQAAAVGTPVSFPALGIFAASNDRSLHQMASGPTGGTWPAGWTPVATNGPVQGQPFTMAAAFTGGMGNILLVSGQDGRVYCFNASTGATLWTSADFGVLQARPMVILRAAGYPGAKDLVIVGTRNADVGNSVVALDLVNGNTLWTFTNSGGPDGDGSIGIVNGPVAGRPNLSRVYFASRSRAAAGGSSHTLWALNVTDGSATRAWSLALGDIDGSPTFHATTGNLLVGTNAGSVVSVTTGGVQSWTRSLGDGAVKEFVIHDSARGRLYLATTTTVWSILDTGAAGSEWTAAVSSPTRPVQQFGTTRLYVGACGATCADGRVVELDVASGTGWTTKTYDLVGTGGLGSVIIDRAPEPDVLHAGSRSGRVVAVQVPLP